MKLLDYKRRILPPGYLPFPEAVKRICEAKYGANWTDNRLNKYLPSSLQRDKNTKSLHLKRWTVLKGGRRYQISSVRLKISETDIIQLKPLKQDHRAVEKLLLSLVATGKLKGMLSLPYHPRREVDQSIENVLRAQSDIVFCTSYVGLHIDGCLFYGMVLFAEQDIAKIVKGETAFHSPHSYVKLTRKVEEDYRTLISRLSNFSFKYSQKHSDNRKPQFIAGDFATEQARRFLSTMSGEPRYEPAGLSPDSMRKLLRRLFGSSELFSAKSGGRANSAKREIAQAILRDFWSSTSGTREQDDESSEEIETSD